LPKHSHIILLAILISSSTFAEAQSGLCENLSHFSCSPGIQNDGTGVARSGAETKKATEAFDELRPHVEQKFKRLLENPENTEFRRLALSTTGLNDAPYCKSIKKEDLDKCNYDIATGLTRLTRRKLTLNNKIENMAEMNDLRSKSLLIENDVFASVIKDIDKEVGEKYGQPKIAERIEKKIFPEILKLLVKKIQSLPIDEKAKTAIEKKITAIRFAGTDCSDSSGGGLSKHFHPNANYSPELNSFRVCHGLFVENSSDFHLAGVIAHELAHAIDPCIIAKYPEKYGFDYKHTDSVDNLDDDYPISGLLGCLRSDRSIAAKRMNDGIYNNPHRGKSKNEKDFYSHCNSDQITESTCDWYAMEILPEFIQQNHPNLTKEQWQIGFSNVFRPGCTDKKRTDKEKEKDQDEHPELTDRIDRIFLQNPTVREKMGCIKPHSKFVYCDPNNVEFLKQIAEEKRSTKKTKALSPISSSQSEILKNGVR
jgi:hypothetical protein